MKREEGIKYCIEASLLHCSWLKRSLVPFIRRATFGEHGHDQEHHSQSKTQGAQDWRNTHLVAQQIAFFEKWCPQTRTTCFRASRAPRQSLIRIVR
jgi:hypothetical protein